MPTNEDSVLSQYVPGFRANLNLAPQQTDSKLIRAVDADLSHSEPGTMFNADDIGTSDPEDVQTRVPDTPDKFLGFTRRVGMFATFQDSAWLDNVDKAATLEDPTNPTMAALMAGRWRKADDYIINQGMFGSAYTRADENAAPTPVAFPNAQIVPANLQSVVHQDEEIPAASADYGLSVGKLLRARTILRNSEVEGELYIAVSPDQLEDLLARIPVTSTYYAGASALVEGKVTRFLGFEFIELPEKRLPYSAAGSGIRRIPAWVKQAVVYKGREITNASIRIRHDKSDTPQAFYKAQHGASRRYDAAVVDIRCKEPAAS